MFIWYYDYLLLSLLPWQWFSFTLTLYHKIHELFYLWCQTNLKLQEKLCNKCPSGNSSETAVVVTFLARSLALHRTTEPQEALWQYNLKSKVENSLYSVCGRIFNLSHSESYRINTSIVIENNSLSILKVTNCPVWPKDHSRRATCWSLHNRHIPRTGIHYVLCK